MIEVPLFRFDLTGGGWADLTIGAAGHAHRIESISYSTDAFGDLVRCGLLLATGAPRATVRFDGEPIETYLDFETIGASAVRLSCLQHYGAPPRALDDLKADPDALLFAADLGGSDGVASAILACAEAVLAEHGERGFKAGWIEDDFPLRATRALRAALA